jgi:hypothetical protein
LSRRSYAKADRSQFPASRQEHAVSLFAFLVAILTAFPATAQIQKAWVARYNNGITNGTNQAVKMVLDSSGNIYVIGFSQNTNNQLGYVTIKYAPNGNQVWVARYDSTNSPVAVPTALSLDASNNVIVTGSALTVKYDTNGNQLWTAPYAGTALAVDSNANVYVAGFSQNFGTVKLSPQGSNVWLNTYVETYGPTVSQSVLVDSGNNVYVSGLDSYVSFYNNGMLYGPYVTLTTIKYNSNGGQLWKASYAPVPSWNNVQVGGAALDAADNLYLMSNWPGIVGYFTIKYSAAGSNVGGTLVWDTAPNENVNSQGTALALEQNGNLVVTGKAEYFSPYFQCGSFEISSNGSPVWTNYYPQPGVGVSGATSITVDAANNCYVTGYSPGTGTNSNDEIVTIKYDPNGNQVWLQKYISPGNGNAVGNAIAVDNNGNVYVAGYDTTTAGGTEMVLIKYSPLTLQRMPDGTVLLETQGSPGESFDIEASIDLLNWLDLGTVLADTNGLMQFDDTNAPSFPSRFYYTNPQ